MQVQRFRRYDGGRLSPAHAAFIQRRLDYIRDLVRWERHNGA